MAVNAAGSLPHQFDSYKNLMFQITWPGDDEENCNIWLVASNLQEKEAWCSDISQVSYSLALELKPELEVPTPLELSNHDYHAVEFID